MTVQIDAECRRRPLRDGAVSLLTCAAVIGIALLRPSAAEAAATKDLTPVWEPGAVVELPLPAPSPELAASFATRPESRSPTVELAALVRADTTPPLGFGGQRSGLPWASGSTGNETFGTWRGRPQDIHVIFSGRDSWDSIRGVPRWGSTRRYARTARVSLGLAMLTNAQRGNFAGCAAGMNDEHIRAVARGLVANGAGDSVVRLGWEMNGRGYPWSVGNFSASTSLYRDCFIRLASIIRSEAPDVLIEWTPRKSTDPRLRLDSLYPGDEYVDIVGLLYYDWYPASPTEADWLRNMVKRDKYGGPSGLGTWLEYARDRGKPLAIPEWGIGKHGMMNPFDNPLFIEKMYEFFRNNASDIAYEAYFNGITHKLFTGSGELLSASMNSAQAYLRLYRSAP